MHPLPVALLLLFCQVLLTVRAASRPESRAAYRETLLAFPNSAPPGFTSMPAVDTGVLFTNVLTEVRATANRILEDGSGIALGDVDGDGNCDIYLGRLEGPNALYRNLGNWKFDDVTAEAGVACDGQFSTGSAFADIDSDGDLDLLVNGVGVGTRLFLNDGKGHFRESSESGLLRKYGSTSLALADIDGDGDLDLYVTNYRSDTVRDAPPGVKAEFFRAPDGQVIVEPADRFLAIPKGKEGINLVERGEPDILYRNDGKGVFTPVSWTDGTFLDEEGRPLRSAPLFWGLTVAMRDLNGDGAPDIYVCNDFNYSPDQIWINDGTGRFRSLPRLAMREMTWSAMSVDFADINRDGALDFIVVDMLSRDHTRRQTQRMNFRPEAMMLPFGTFDNRPEYMRNTLFLNRGDNTYAEIAQLSGLEASEWTWSAVFLDVDLDGYEDLLLANGSGHDILDSDVGLRLREMDRAGRSNRQTKVLSMFPPLRTANLAFRNRGDLTFEETGRRWGFDLAEISNAMALGDLDNDGDLDVVLNNLNARATLYRNNGTAPRVAVRLRGPTGNIQGIGAQIEVVGGPVRQSQEMTCSGRYLSCDQAMKVFATGSISNSLQIKVTWRNGAQTTVRDAQPNRIYEVDPPADGPPFTRTDARTQPDAPVSSPRVPTLFEDVSHLLNHSHHDEPFDDYGRQPLLPRKLSQLGPGITWFDVNQDGFDDLILGSGRGGRLAVLENQGGQGFRPSNAPVLATPMTRDQTTVLGWKKDMPSIVLLAGSANYEDGFPGGPCVRQFAMNTPKIDDTLPGQPSSTGPMALGDYDGDGDLDLFVGGRVIAGQYPLAASSLVFRNDAGSFVLDKECASALAHVGLVSAAVFTDLNNDGIPELVLACEWGPIRVFRHEQGGLVEATERWGLTQTKGWWNGITAGDFDDDGRMDLAASNWGRNTKYEGKRHDGLRLYYGDLTGSGRIETLEAYVDHPLDKVVPWRSFEVVSAALPFIRENYTSFRAFGTASISELLGTRSTKAQQLEVTLLDSIVLLNRGDHFELLALPGEAQWAPAFGIAAADLDGDGREDLFLSQNFFPVELETSRYDAGRGLLLRGLGSGQFQPVRGQESGIKIYGDQRGCAVADYDRDGRIDLAVGQHANATCLLHNVAAKPGLRVRLHGPPGNPDGVGAVVRLKFGDRLGPAHEIHAGSGYWSQDSSTIILATPMDPTQIVVRWPGGRSTVSEIPNGARAIEVNDAGIVSL